MSAVSQAKRIVVKVGTSTLTYENGKLNLRRTEELCKVLSDLHNSGLEVVLVSSGAVGVGMGKLGIKERPTETEKKQAIAAVGQCELMFMYDKLFGEYNCMVAQVLLTADVTASENSKRNVENTFRELLNMDIIPVVNENDTVSIDELDGPHFGDNDTLSAVVAVDVALSLGLEDQLALISTGLTCVSADVAALVCVGVQNALVGLTVDEDDGSLRGLDGINDGLSGSGLDGVDDQNVHTLLQEGVDLLGLGVLVVLAIDDGDGVAHVLQVLFQVGAVQGHEVISKLIDADADVSRAGSSSCGRRGSGRSCSRGSSSRSGRTAAGSQNAGSTHNSGSFQEVTTRNHFHNLVLLH